jgi:hypothetical protein
MTEATTEKYSNLFERLYDLGKEGLKAMKQPLIANQVKRKLQSAFDDAENKKDTAVNKLNTAREDLVNYNVNVVLEAQKMITECNTLQDAIKAEYKELFGKDMPLLDLE